MGIGYGYISCTQSSNKKAPHTNPNMQFLVQNVISSETQTEGILFEYMEKEIIFIKK